jgi:hypothetical protein
MKSGRKTVVIKIPLRSIGGYNHLKKRSVVFSKIKCSVDNRMNFGFGYLRKFKFEDQVRMKDNKSKV